MVKFLQSTEHYKWYIIELWMHQDYNHTAVYHKHCIVKDENGNAISAGKSKKEMKDLIDCGCIKI